MEGQQRKKVPLKPGHSLMNWMTLQRENKNMSGVTVQGKPVTKEELRAHKTAETGVWTALKVCEERCGALACVSDSCGRETSTTFRPTLTITRVALTS